MTSENMMSPANTAGERYDTPLSFEAFRQRMAAAEGVFETWVRCTVVDNDRVDGEDFIRVVSSEESAADVIGCVLADELKAALEARHGARMQADELVGSTLYLRIRAVPGERLAISDVEPAWIEACLQRMLRARMREMAEFHMLDLQQHLPDPELIRRIGVIVAKDDPTWPSVQASLDLIAATGPGYVVELASFDGWNGTMALNGVLKRMADRVAEEDVDVVLIAFGGVLQDSLSALQDDEIATLIGTMAVPVVVGLPRPRCGSLVHRVAFAAADTPFEAVMIVTALVRAAAIAPERDQRLQAWHELLAERYAWRQLKRT
jgi:hypothetical protein